MRHFLALSLLFIGITACTHNAITGRSQLSLVSEADMQATATYTIQPVFISK